MLDELSRNGSQIWDGLLFGLGVLAVYLGAVLTGALIRSLGGAGSAGLTFAGRYVQGWFDYLRGDDRNTINITLNMIVDDQLKFETLVADRRIWYVWPNSYRMQMIRRAARRTTIDNPIVMFPEHPRRPRSFVGRLRHRWRLRVHALVTRATVTENGRSQRVRLVREDDYKATYGPLISLISEQCNNDNAIDLELGRDMEEHRFVIALTFEKLDTRRARHLRAMVMWEEALRNLPPECPRVDFPEHRTRFRTLQAIAKLYEQRPECFGIVKVWRPLLAGVTRPPSARR
ncbi:MAG: hypothetical protein IT537_15095 [Hyphomicrobiales bacterium]|nr:hypothetical protein [Hyphomicrobiales bacterium]